MDNKMVVSYGSWRSPIAAEILADNSRFSDLRIDTDGTVYWIESRSNERGRNALVRQLPNGEIEDVLPADTNVRSFVHTYGGAPYMVHEGTVYYVNFTNPKNPNFGQIWIKRPGDEPEQLTHTLGQFYADMAMDLLHNRIISVCEDHRGEGEATNSIVGISLEDGSVASVAEGMDFYSSPRLSSEGRFLAYITWKHPNMPWDTTTLEVKDAMRISTANTRVLDSKNESIAEPKWNRQADLLYFISDRSGFWNLYSWDETTVRPICPMEAEFTFPQWNLGESHYDFTEDGRIAAAYTRDGVWNLGIIDALGNMTPLDLPYTEIANVHTYGDYVYFLGGSPTESISVVRVNLKTQKYDVIRKPTSFELDPEYISMPVPITFPTADGEVAHALYFPPRNAEFRAPEHERPPLLVTIHGGPTAAAPCCFSPGVQYWTTRGFGVLAVNYRGSSGYGTAYRKRLNGCWGVADVQDCVYGAKHLADKDIVDRNRMAIRGGSAGGFTALAAVAFYDVFAAAASHFGVSDLEALAKETHKFESHYMDTLIGGSYPDAKDVYEARSPIYHIKKIKNPVIFFQGTEDTIVPPNQSQEMYDALKERGVKTALVLFEGEGHGFRKKSSIIETAEGELYFYSKIFDFDLPGNITPIEIANLYTQKQ
ncbi:prolyl oligopeptidase family serine peptidase [bacterium]|nr:prolyl oligopeptidase family serine peptidase [bacterium]